MSLAFPRRNRIVSSNVRSPLGGPEGLLLLVLLLGCGPSVEGVGAGGSTGRSVGSTTATGRGGNASQAQGSGTGGNPASSGSGGTSAHGGGQGGSMASSGGAADSGTGPGSGGEGATSPGGGLPCGERVPNCLTLSECSSDPSYRGYANKCPFAINCGFFPHTVTPNQMPQCFTIPARGKPGSEVACAIDIANNSGECVTATPDCPTPLCVP